MEVQVIARVRGAGTRRAYQMGDGGSGPAPIGNGPLRRGQREVPPKLEEDVDNFLDRRGSCAVQDGGVDVVQRRAVSDAGVGIDGERFIQPAFGWMSGLGGKEGKRDVRGGRFRPFASESIEAGGRSEGIGDARGDPEDGDRHGVVEMKCGGANSGETTKFGGDACGPPPRGGPDRMMPVESVSAFCQRDYIVRDIILKLALRRKSGTDKQVSWSCWPMRGEQSAGDGFVLSLS